jgi:hypothetical protein
VRRHSRRAALRRKTTSTIAPSPIASARCTVTGAGRGGQLGDRVAGHFHAEPPGQGLGGANRAEVGDGAGRARRARGSASAGPVQLPAVQAQAFG